MQELTLLKTPIRCDDVGRFCLNDLHRAAGAEKTHQPSNWLRLDTTRRLIEEISESSDMRNKPVEAEAGRYGGTYVVKELVYAYAMWVSPTFHVAVIRAFDAMVTGPGVETPPPLPNEHPFVTQFWEAYEELIERGERVNYSDRQGLIAINLTRMIHAALRHGLPIVERSKLGPALKTSLRRPFIGHEDMFFRSRRIPKCWIFRDDDCPQPTADATPFRLAGTVSATSNIVFS